MVTEDELKLKESLKLIFEGIKKLDESVDGIIEQKIWRSDYINKIDNLRNELILYKRNN